MIINTGSEFKIPKYEITVQRVILDDDPSLYPDGVAKEIVLTDAQKARYEEIRYRTDLPMELAESYIFRGEGEIPDTRTLEEKLIDKVIELDPEAIQDESIKSALPVWLPPEERDPQKPITYDRFAYLVYDGVVYKTIHPIRNFEEGTPPERPDLYTRIGAQSDDGQVVVEEWTEEKARALVYVIGSRAMYQGKLYEVILGNADGINTWKPDEYGWKEVV